MDMLLTMKEAGILSEKFCEKGEQERSEGLLMQQQEAAIRIGEIIEQIEGEDHKFVRKLEDHCELLWKCSLAKSEERYEAYRNLRQNYIQLEEEFKNEISEQYEIVFLPYKASMWDSFESVWKAANEDPDCLCYVVPIPYYNRNVDGSLAEMNYEGNLFPQYVSITDYRSYELESYPDAIFIHNPYDDGNRITSIHPDYYSERLKQFTKVLVYIPYFISMGDVQKHLCITSGVRFADKVIVQSEKVRETYIKTIYKFETENHCKGLFGNLKQKFQALGSPKVDKVVTTIAESLTLPETWQKLICDLNGGRKRVLLYNTSIASQLEYREDFILKIKWVLKKMEKEQDLVLLWRPHPLAMETYASMQPELGQNYQKIVKYYKEAGWGIYDDTADVNRAIAISDALYGDPSSLAELYKVTGKPIIIQDVKINQFEL